jgi:hypothetical protein
MEKIVEGGLSSDKCRIGGRGVGKAMKRAMIESAEGGREPYICSRMGWLGHELACIASHGPFVHT